MKIRKQFKFESSHIVRNCSTKRCSQNNHGHSGKIEVFFSADKLDNGGMIYDFGLTKKNIGKFLDAFDHCWHFWNKEEKKIKDFIRYINARWIELPFSPTAENYSIYFLKAINYLLEKTPMLNGEGKIICTGVRYHETDTGYAESELKDLKWHSYYNLEDIVFSEELKKDIGDMFKEAKQPKIQEKVGD